MYCRMYSFNLHNINNLNLNEKDLNLHIKKRKNQQLQKKKKKNLETISKFHSKYLKYSRQV